MTIPATANSRDAQALRDDVAAFTGALDTRFKPGDIVNPGTMVAHIEPEVRGTKFAPRFLALSLDGSRTITRL